MVIRLQAKPAETPVGRREVVQVLAALDDDEFRSVLDEARGAALVPLAELVVEGVASSISELRNRCRGAVVLDDVGRQCVTRETARALFGHRAGAC